MKKILFTLALCCFISQQAESKWRPIPKDECPKGVICKANEILGDDGKCYSCDAPEKISIQCIGYDKVQQICPDRLFGYPMIWSFLNCGDDKEVYQEDGNEKKFCVSKCPAGYDHVDPFKCVNKETGMFIIEEI